MKSIIQKLLMLIVFSSLSMHIFSQKQNLNYSIFTLSDELTENANEVVRVDNTKIFVRNRKSATMKTKAAVTLLNDQSDANEFVLHYTSQTEIKGISALIYDKMGKLIRKMDKNEIQDYSAISGFSIYEDSRVKYFELSYSDYPYTIEVEYEQQLTGISFAVFPNWYIQNGYNQSVESSLYELKFPNTLAFLHKAYNTELTPKISEEKGVSTYLWKAKNIPAIKSEVLTDYTAEVPYVLISPEKFMIDNYQGSMKNWKDYGDFMNLLWKGRNKVSPEMEATIKELTKNATTNKEKIDLLYQYMQDNMRYVSVQLGIGGWQPFDANYVEKNKYGDCKALTNFMMSMLDVVGIDSAPALISAGNRNPKIEEDFTSPRFNHVILNIPSEDYWLECTSNYSPPNYMSNWTADKTVMIMSEEGGKLAKTPALKPEDNLSERKISVQLSNEGAAILAVESNLYCSNQDRWRHYSFEKSAEDLRIFFQTNSKMPTFKIDELKVTPSRKEPLTTLNYQVQINRYASKVGKRLFIPVNVVSPHTYIPPKMKERTQQINIKNGYADNDKIVLALPSGYKVESLPKGKQEIKSTFGSYSIEFEEKENKVICHRSFVVRPATIPAENYDKVRKFYKDIVKADKVKLVLVEVKNEIKP